MKQLQVFKTDRRVASTSINTFVGEFTAILGIRGSGKSSTTAVIIEELLKHNMGMTIIDIDGEYWGLKQKHEILVFGNSDHSDVKLEADKFIDIAGSLAKEVLDQRLPIIIDLSEYDEDEQQAILLTYFTTLWKYEQTYRTPHMIVLEEAHEFIPQGISTKLKSILIKCALRGRKRGISCILVSQRSAKVDKNVITQANAYFLHRVMHPTDLIVYQDFLPLTKAEIKKLIPSLKNGEVIFKLGDKHVKKQVRLRETFHAGTTPSLEDDVVVPKLRNVAKELIQAFNKIKPRDGKTEVSKLKQELEKKILETESLEKKVDKLEDQLQTISRIKVQLVHGEIASQPVVNGVQAPITISQFSTVINRHLKRTKDRMKRYMREFKILVFLEDKSPNTYTTRALASNIGMTRTQMQNNSPKGLIKIGIISRDNTRSGEYEYRSIMKEFVRDEFSQFDTEELEVADEIYNHLREWIDSVADDETGTY